MIGVLREGKNEPVDSDRSGVSLNLLTSLVPDRATPGYRSSIHNLTTIINEFLEATQCIFPGTTRIINVHEVETC